MPITHVFVSAKSDGGDATLVRPSNWNADHDSTHEADTVDAHEASAISTADPEFGGATVEDALVSLLLMWQERTGAAFPAQPAYGSDKWFYRYDLNRFYYYDGSMWGGAGGGGQAMVTGADETLAAGRSTVAVSDLEIGAGFVYEVGIGSVLEIA